MPQYQDKFDHGVMDKFLNLSELPIIGSSALEQILHQASLDYPAQPQMSPDSSQWTQSSSGVESGSESLDGDCLPDSTVQDTKDDTDTCSVNSDPLNSSSSEYSFAASPPVFENILADDSGVGHTLDSSPVSSGPAGGIKRKSAGSDDSAPTKKRSRKSKAGPHELCCPLCEYTTRVKEHLASHMNSHTSDRKYMCNQCGQTFKWSHSLRRHQRTHQKDYKFTCSHCPKTFSRKDHLAVHEKLHDADNTESYPCPECGVKFKNKKTLTGHVKTHSTDKPHKCDSCDSAFTRKASLTRHVLAAHAGHVFHCDICNASFSYKSTLEDHRRAVHNEGKRDFHCTGCGLSFACKAYLQKHTGVCKNRPDKGEIPCTECGKLFPSRRHLQEHKRTKHRDNLATVSNVPSVPSVPMVEQNMGHNLGQYFTVTRPPCDGTLPPFSRQSLGLGVGGYHQPPSGASASVMPGHRADFPAESHLEKHFPTHWPSQEEASLKLTGHDLTLSQIQDPVEENVGSILRQVYNTEHHHHHQDQYHHNHKHIQDPAIFCDYSHNFEPFLYYNA